MSNDIDKEFKRTDNDLLKGCLAIMNKEMLKPTSEVSDRCLATTRRKIDELHDVKRLTDLLEFS